MSDRTDFGLLFALVGGSGTLFGTYMYWVLRTDGLHSTPPSVLLMTAAHPLSVLGPVIFVTAVTYLVGLRVSVERYGHRLERVTTGVAAAVGLLVGLGAVSSMFFNWVGTESGPLSVGGFVRALIRYPDTVVLLTVVVASPVYLGTLGVKWVLSLLRSSVNGAGDSPTDDRRSPPGTDDRWSPSDTGGRRRVRADSNDRPSGEQTASQPTPERRRSEGRSTDQIAAGSSDDGGSMFAGEPIPPCPVAKWETLDVERSLEGGGSLARTADGDRVVLERLSVDGTVHNEAIDAFVDRAETWGGLASHDHVLGVAGYGTAPVPWLAVEFPDGGTLAGRSDLSFRAASAVAVATCDALRFAHNRGVTHGAIRPEHVAFRERDGVIDVPKLGGWAARADDGVSAPAYAAPEQFRDEPVDVRTDVYRTAAVLYHLFTGRAPFEGESTQVMGQALTTRPTPPSEVDGTLPSKLDEVLLDGLATDPADRYDSVVYLRDGIGRIAGERDG